MNTRKTMTLKKAIQTVALFFALLGLVLNSILTPHVVLSPGDAVTWVAVIMAVLTI